MANRYRNEAFFAGSSSSEAPSVSKQLIKACQTGQLTLRDLGLHSLPEETFDIASHVPAGVNWWESHETLLRLDASQNKLSGIPPSIASLQRLTSLNLSFNQLDSLPEADVWSQLVSLVSLQLGHNALEGLPDGLGGRGLPPLVHLSLSHNRLHHLPSSLAEMPLESLDVSHNRLEAFTGFGGSLGGSLGAHAHLRELNLSSNRIQSLTSLTLNPPPNIERLELGDNSLTELVLVRQGAGQQGGGQMGCSQMGCGQMGCGRLNHLSAPRNQITSLEIDGCEALRELIVPHNLLVELPKAIADGKLKSLATADLSHNRIQRLSTGMVHLEAMQRLDLSNNALTQVPAELGLMTQVINPYSPYVTPRPSTPVNPRQPASTRFNPLQPPSTPFNPHLPPSTPFNPLLPPSTPF